MIPATDPRQHLLTLLTNHPSHDDAEAQDVAFITDFVRTHQDCLAKANPLGHITASAFVTDPAGRVLMTHHAKLNRWLQVGGHTDPHEWDPAEAALREAQEESGLTDLTLLHPTPIDIDVHRIPARKATPAPPSGGEGSGRRVSGTEAKAQRRGVPGVHRGGATQDAVPEAVGMGSPSPTEVPAHDHLDIRYTLQTQTPDAIAITHESTDLRWFTFAQLDDLPGLDAALRRALNKVQAQLKK